MFALTVDLSHSKIPFKAHYGTTFRLDHYHNKRQGHARTTAYPQF